MTWPEIGPKSHYSAEMFPGQVIVGIGLGPALPDILLSATAGLSGDRGATGSVVINRRRQIGCVIGVSVPVALLGTPLTKIRADVLSGMTPVPATAG